MKRIIYVALLAVSAVSCKDFLNEQPVSELSSENFWQSEADIVAAVAGMYDGVQNLVDDYYIDWGEGRSDNFTRGGTGEAEYAFAFNAMTSDMAATDWTELYSVVLRANLIIRNAPKIDGDLSETERNNYLAQAFAVRAYCHLLGVKVWGDIPLITEIVENRTTLPSRTPADEVLEAVVTDLLRARELVNSDNINIFEVNLGGILAILSEAYMWQHNYEKVIEVTDELLATGRYALAENPDEWKQIFTDPSRLEPPSEPIWSIYRDILKDRGSGLAKIGSGDHTSAFIIDQDLLSKWEEQGDRDFRENLTYDTLIVSQEGVAPFIWKYYPLLDGKTPQESMSKRDEAQIRNPLYRLSDILLLRAEAYNQLNNKQEAVEILNSIRIRAGLEPVFAGDFNSVDELETAILDERQLELIGEGKRWFDLRRTGHVIDVMEPVLRRRQFEAGLTVIGFGDPGLILFPINRNVLNANPNLKQNPPYTK